MVKDCLFELHPIDHGRGADWVASHAVRVRGVFSMHQFCSRNGVSRPKFLRYIKSIELKQMLIHVLNSVTCT